MSIKRKRNKKNPRYTFLIELKNQNIKNEPENFVKRYFESSKKSLSLALGKNKNAYNSGQYIDLDSFKKDIKKSLIFTLLIISLEIVIYFAWKR